MFKMDCKKKLQKANSSFLSPFQSQLAWLLFFVLLLLLFVFAFFLSLNNEPRLEILFVEEVAKVKGSRFSLPEKEKRCG